MIKTKRFKMDIVLITISILINVCSIAAVIYAFSKSDEIEKVVAEEFSKSIREDHHCVYCPTYDSLNQIDEKQKNFAYVYGPEDKKGMYLWVPNENRWVFISK